jgi:hypothetical protein
MRRSRRLYLFAPAATLALVAGPLALSGGTAHAAAADCTAGEVCVWPSANYTGPVTVLLDDLCHNATVGSALNGDSDPQQELRVYSQPDCAGSATMVKAGAQAPSAAGQSYLNWHAASAAP